MTYLSPEARYRAFLEWCEREFAGASLEQQMALGYLLRMYDPAAADFLGQALPADDASRAAKQIARLTAPLE